MRDQGSTAQFVARANTDIQQVIDLLTGAELEQVGLAQRKLEEMIRSFSAMGRSAIAESRGGERPDVSLFRAHLRRAEALNRMAAETVDRLAKQAGIYSAENPSNIRVEG